MAKILTKPVLWFCLLTYLISWSWFALCYGTGLLDKKYGFTITAALFMFAPAIAALLCARRFNKGHMVQSLGLKFKGNRWLFVAWLTPLLICALSFLISLAPESITAQSLKTGLLSSGLIPEDTPLPEFFNTIMIFQAIIIGAAINGVILLSEELGWRGFLWQALDQDKKSPTTGFWTAALFTGIVWGFWHAPLIYIGHNYPTMPILGIFLMVGFTILLSPIIGHIRDKNGSVWAASLFHGTLNAVASLSIIALASTTGKTPPLWNGIMGLGGAIIMALLCVAVYFARKPTKSR